MGEVLTSLVSFIPTYFTFFEAIANGRVSMISFSVCFLVTYRKKKAIDFCKIVHHIAEFIYCFQKCSGRTLFEGSLMYSIMPSASGDNLTSSIPISISLILFSCLISTSTLSTILKGREDSGHSCPTAVDLLSGLHHTWRL